MAIDDLTASLRARLDQLDREEYRLRGALQALNGKPAPQPRVRLSREQAKEARAKLEELGPRRIEVAPAGKLLKILGDHHDGLSAAALAKAANAEVEQVNVLLREMEAEGRVRRTGQRRGMGWHVAAAK